MQMINCRFHLNGNIVQFVHRWKSQNDVDHLSHWKSVEMTRAKERSAVVTTRLTLPQQYMHAKKPNYLILPDLPRLHQHSSPGDMHRSSLEINDHTCM